MTPREIFSIRSKKDFEAAALKIFRFQAKKNPVYKKYIEQLGIVSEKIKITSEIPFLPIEFFKTHEIISRQSSVVSRQSSVFLSSGTSGMERSKHCVSDISIYEKNFRKCFQLFYGEPKQYAVLAVLPSYYANKNSSLLYMTMDLIKRSRNKYSAFYTAKDENILQAINILLKKKQKIILFGVSFALLELAEKIPARSAGGSSPLEGLENLIVMETGGMKGRREEITREQLHKILSEKFRIKKIHSEYGMTELLSQAYSTGNGIFKSPPWMKVFARDVNDPFQILSPGKTGALNIIDLANIYSCSFIATQDVGKIHSDGSFEVLGRMDNSDLRGCSLMEAN
ncbi:MAG: acyl transferase [Bacteroidetes bacterium]|nr:acyl transferase [Bacteroidota bacterium]